MDANGVPQPASDRHCLESERLAYANEITVKLQDRGSGKNGPIGSTGGILSIEVI
jgi:hypothetical protein